MERGVKASMNIPDYWFIVINILIVALYLFLMWRAYKKGFLYELFNFIGFIFAFLFAWFIAPILAEQFPLIASGTINDLADELLVGIALPICNTLIWFIIILVVVRVILAIILSLFKAVSKIPVLGFFNRLLGTFFGIVNATIWVMIISMLLSLPFFTNGQAVKEGTLIKHINNLSNSTLVFVTEHIDVKGLSDSISDELTDVDDAREAFVVWMKKHGIINE